MTTQSVLDLMTASIIESKAAKGAKLTPVGLEAPAPALPRTTASFPNDHPDEAILQRISILEELYAKLADLDEREEELRRLIRAQYAGIREAVDAAKTALGVAPGADARPAAEVQREKERAADARVAASQTAQDAREDESGADAQPAAEPPVTPEGFAAAGIQKVLDNMDRAQVAAQAAVFGTQQASDGWQCPTHHAFAMRTSRLGRQYRACPTAGCREFEKL